MLNRLKDWLCPSRVVLRVKQQLLNDLVRYANGQHRRIKEMEEQLLKGIK